MWPLFHPESTYVGIVYTKLNIECTSVEPSPLSCKEVEGCLITVHGDKSYTENTKSCYQSAIHKAHGRLVLRLLSVWLFLETKGDQ